jgi:hypothetical protein
MAKMTGAFFRLVKRIARFSRRACPPFNRIRRAINLENALGRLNVGRYAHDMSEPGPPIIDYRRPTESVQVPPSYPATRFGRGVAIAFVLGYFVDLRIDPPYPGDPQTPEVCEASKLKRKAASNLGRNSTAVPHFRSSGDSRLSTREVGSNFEG